MKLAAPELARASRLIGSAHLRRVAKHGAKMATADGQELQALGLMGPLDTIADALKKLHDSMQQEYRIETIYKNAIARKFLVSRKAPTTATLLQELRVNNSIVDMVLLNNFCEAFEIKTAFDSPDKLQKQLGDYYRAFTRVTVVCDERKATQYLDHLQDSPAGLMVLSRRGAFKSIRNSRVFSEHLNIETMMSMLRQDEYMDIIHEHFGPQPEQPNTLRYRHYLSMSEKMAPIQYSELMEHRLKARKPRNCVELLDPKVKPILSSLLRVNPTPSQYRNIMDWLNQRGGEDVFSVSTGQAI